MHKFYLILLLLFSSSNIIFSQNTTLKVIYSLQEHDKRFFGNSGPIEYQKRDWGTHYYGFSIHKDILSTNYLKLQLGLGYGVEVITYHSPYNHCYFNPPGEECSLDLKWIRDYSIDLIPISFTPKYLITQTLNFNFDIKTQFHFYKEVTGGGTRSAAFKVGLYSIELNPEFEYLFGQASIALGYRIAQYKITDPVFMPRNALLPPNSNPQSQKNHTYNPTKLILSFSYRL